MSEQADFKTTVVAALGQLGPGRRPRGHEVLLLGQSADGKLWSSTIRRRYWLLERMLVSAFIRSKALDRIAIVVPSRVLLLDRTDPIDAGTGQDRRIKRLSSAARNTWQI